MHPSFRSQWNCRSGARNISVNRNDRNGTCTNVDLCSLDLSRPHFTRYNTYWLLHQWAFSKNRNILLIHSAPESTLGIEWDLSEISRTQLPKASPLSIWALAWDHLSLIIANSPCWRESTVIVVTSRSGLINVGRTQTEKLTNRMQPAHGTYGVRENVPFRVLVTKLLKRSVTIPKNMRNAVWTDQLETIVEYDELAPSSNTKVNAVRSGEWKHRWMQVERHQQMASKDESKIRTIVDKKCK